MTHTIEAADRMILLQQAKLEHAVETLRRIERLLYEPAHTPGAPPQVMDAYAVAREHR